MVIKINLNRTKEVIPVRNVFKLSCEETHLAAWDKDGDLLICLKYRTPQI